MSKFYVIFAFIFTNLLNAQIVTIPDANFKAKLLQAGPGNQIAKNLSNQFFKIDQNNDGEIQLSEALQVSQLNVSSSGITSLVGISEFQNILSLYCNLNNIATLDVQGLSQLVNLECYYNHIGSLNVIGLQNLNTLLCHANSLTSIDMTGLEGLEVLSCSGNNIVELDFSSTLNIVSIRCFNNNLTFLNVNELSKLEYLDCKNNQIAELTITGLEFFHELYCNSNVLSQLNLSELQGLTILNASVNQLTSLDISNFPNLHIVTLSSNQLQNLDFTNSNDISNLSVSANQLTTIDVSALKYLSTFHFSNNNLTHLFMKNGVDVFNIDMSANPNLQFICVDDNLIEAMEYKVAQNGYNCTVNSYCSFTLGDSYGIVSVDAKLDVDNNGCTISDPYFPNLKISVSNSFGSGQFIADEVGNYAIPLVNGQHTLVPVFENPVYFTASPVSIQLNIPSAANSVQNFCIVPNGQYNDLEITFLPVTAARPGFDATYKLVYKNKATTVQSGEVTLTFQDFLIDFVFATPSVISQSVNTLTWNYTNLQPFETREIDVTFNINSPMETPPVNADDQLNYFAVITPTAGDEMPFDNGSGLKQIVVNSFDPNDKTCLEGNIISPSMVGEYVHYMIRFENTGSFPAENIVVKDMIDASKFDIATLVPLSGSHLFETRINGDKVEFIFENIMLPFDNAINDGYVAFKIKTLPTLVVGDTFSNSASIYFDYNFPIVTDPAVTSIQALGTTDFDFSKYFSIYPNPANTVLNLKASNEIVLNSISVYNMLGQLILAIPNAETTSAIEVSQLNSGTYFLKINSDKGTTSAKFVKN